MKKIILIAMILTFVSGLALATTGFDDDDKTKAKQVKMKKAEEKKMHALKMKISTKIEKMKKAGASDAEIKKVITEFKKKYAGELKFVKKGKYSDYEKKFKEKLQIMKKEGASDKELKEMKMKMKKKLAYIKAEEGKSKKK